MKRSLARGAAGALAAICLTAPVRAEWTPRVSASGRELRVNDVLVLRARTALAGLLPEQRVALSASRLREVTVEGLEPPQVRVDIETETRWRWATRMVSRTVERTVTRRVGKKKKRRRRVKIEVEIRVPQRYKDYYEVETEARLVARGRVIATASVREADAADAARPSSLAESWSEALKRALRVPGLAARDDGVIVPWQERRTIPLWGAARGPVTIDCAGGASSPVTAMFDARANAIVLSGAAIGRDTLTLSREGATTKIDVAVQPFAGRIETPQPVTVTGAGVDSDRIARLILARARAAVAPLPGATFRIESEPAGVRPPRPGTSVTVGVPVTVVGPEMIPVRQTLRVPVVGTSLPRVETGALFFSNNPERVTDFSTLYLARLDMGAARLLYHHQNGMEAPLWFTAELINDGDAPAQVQVVGGDAGPERDTVWVGYRVASAFLTAFNSDSGMVVEIPAHSRVALQAARMSPGLTLSGLMQLRLLAGPSPLVRVAADRPSDPANLAEILRPYPLSAAVEATVKAAEKFSEHVYPQPLKRLTTRYIVGERWAFLSVGRRPINSTNEDRVLDGNYGVFYDITVAVENPTERPANIQVVFEPAGGMAGAVFVIDGKRVEIPRTSPPTETTIATISLPPGAKKTITMRTLPLSGSNYPINLIVKS